MKKLLLLSVLAICGADTYTRPDTPTPVTPPDPLASDAEWSTGLNVDYSIGIFVPLVTTANGVTAGSPASPWCSISIFSSGWDVQAEPYARYAYSVYVVDYGWPGPGLTAHYSVSGAYGNSLPELDTQFNKSVTSISVTPGWYTVSMDIQFWTYDPMTSTYTWADQTYPVRTDVFVDYPAPYNWYE